MVQIEADDLGPAQPGAEDEVNDRPVAQRSGMPVHRGRGIGAAVAAAGELMEPLDPVQHILDRPHLRPGQGPHFRGRQAQFHGLPVAAEKLREDRIVEEALSGRPDPLHLAAVFGFGASTGVRYAQAARTDSNNSQRPC